MVAGLVVGVGWLVEGEPGTTGVQDASIDTPDPALLDDLPDRRTPVSPPPSASPRCAEGSSLGCFLWAVEVRSVGWDRVAVGADVVAYQEVDGTVTGRGLSDGETLWSATGQATDGDQLGVADDLLVHRDEDDLVGRDLRTGQERWRNPELTSLRIETAQGHGDLVLVSAVQGGPADGLIPRGHAIVALAASTGELRWFQSGESATLAADGTGILSTEDGSLEAYGPDGQQRWSATPTLERNAMHVWPHGHVVMVSDGRGEDRLHHLSDGGLLERDGEPLEAWPMAVDADHTLLVGTESAGDGGWVETSDLVLVGEDGIVWYADGVLEPDVCIDDVQLTIEAVEVVDCGGGVVRLDLRDGSVTSRTDAPQVGDDAHRSAGTWHLGSYQVRHDVDTGNDPDGGLLLWDAVRDVEVARLPGDATPVFGYIDGSWTPDLGGVAVLQSTGWLTAIDLPDGDASGAADTGGGQG